MHYMKCGVNSSLLTQFWLLQKVCGTMNHCFIITHSIHKEGDTIQIYFCVIFHETRHHAQAHVTSGALTHCALSLAARRTQTAAQLGWWFRWPVFVMAISNEACRRCRSRFFFFFLLLLLKIVFNIASLSTLFRVSGSNQNFTDSFLLKFYLFIFFPGHCSRPTIICLV